MDMTSEYDALQGLTDSSPEAKRELLQAQNKAYIEQQLEYSRTKQAAFWRKVWIAANTFGLMLIIYTLFHFS